MNKLLLTILQFAFSVNIFALQIVTEIDPPYNFLDANEKPAGLFIEIVQEIQKRIGNTDEIKFYPWARAFQMASSQENVIIFSMARTKERQDLFHWVGPILDNSWVLVSKKESPLSVKDLEQAKKIKSIGVYRNDARDIYLSNNGFENLNRSNNNSAVFKMLFADRVDAIAVVDIAMEDLLKENGKTISDIKSIFTLSTVQVFIGISKLTPLSVVYLWKSTFEQMKEDGTYERIFRKYFPTRDLPKLL